MTDPTSLRDQHAAQTRERILDAFGLAFSNSDFAALTHARVARQAGVGERTVWRHFPTRRALQDAYIVRAAERYGWTPPPGAAGLAEWASRFFESFLAHAPVGPDEESEALKANRAARFQQIEASLAPVAQHLNARELRAAAAVVHALVSIRTVESWKRQWELDPDQGAAAVRWALATLIGQLLDHGGPSCPAEPPPTRSSPK